MIIKQKLKKIEKNNNYFNKHTLILKKFFIEKNKRKN